MTKVIYKPYSMLRDRMAKIAIPLVSKKIRRLCPDEFMKYVISRAMGMKGMTLTLDCNILVDEESYIDNGPKVYFAETSALLKMLWRAKMDVDLEDLDLSLFPETFSIAWPMTEIAGANLIGCMVSIYPNSERAALVGRFGKKYLDYPLRLITTTDIPDSEVGIHISYSGEKPVVDKFPVMYRCSIPNSFIRECLKGDADFDRKLGTYDNKSFMAMDLDEEEIHQQYVISKLVIHLLVYMQACPEMLEGGYPEGRKAREFGSRYSGKVSPVVLRMPASSSGAHGSPDAHWRNPHFRSYPRKRNGTKKKGIVSVRGTLVNADVDAVTVKGDELEVL